jgi:hypothetical protein
MADPMDDKQRLELAIVKTSVIRQPKQLLATFGVTAIRYYLLTLPSYDNRGELETVVRTGRVIADRPKIVTPQYLSKIDGFSAEAAQYFQKLTEEFGPDTPALFYTYRNEPGNTEIVSNGLEETACRINEQIDNNGDQLAAVIQGDDALWDVSVMKFIFDITSASLSRNISDMNTTGLLNMRDGVPNQARMNIETMFSRLSYGDLNPRELQMELERWGLFESYQDRFLSAIRRV